MFCISQWDKAGIVLTLLSLTQYDFQFSVGSPPSAWFISYKLLVTVLTVSLTAAHIVSTTERLGSKWLIFLTNQGMLLIILHNLLHLYIIVR